MKPVLLFLASFFFAFATLPAQSFAQSPVKTANLSGTAKTSTESHLSQPEQTLGNRLSGTNTYCNIGISCTLTNVDCKGSYTGSIKLSVSGCYGTVTYKWSDGATTKDRTGLKAGSYTVTVTDKGYYYSCTATKTFTITEPASAVSVTGLVVNVSKIGLNDGAIDVTVSGGTPPYTYKWNDGPTTQDRSGLASGSYTVVVTDSKGCHVSKTFTIVAPTCKLGVGGTIQDVSCNGGSNGAISISVTGAVGLLSFLWNDGATTQSRTGLRAGSYSLTVTDNGTGCKTVTPAFIISQPSAIGVTAVIGIVSQTGANNGSITLTVTGGTPPYAFQWNDGITTQNRTGLAPGNYSVTITDAHGCQVVKTFTVSTCNLDASATLQHISCFGGNNGAISLSVLNGTGNYTFKWNDGITTQNRTGLTAGNYSVTITDQSTGCAVTRSFLLYQPAAPLDVNGVTVNATNNLANGSITLTAMGGTPPYTYLWNDGVTTQNRTGLTPGSYTVTVTDANSCKTQKPFTLTNISCNLSITGTPQGVNCYGAATGSISITAVSGATGALSYAWNDGVTTANRSGLPAGTYMLTVTDQSTQCKATRSFVISQPSAPLTVVGSTVNARDGLANGSITLTVTGGTPPYAFQWNDGITTQNRTGLAPGNYSVTITDAHGCTAAKTFTINGLVCSLAITPTLLHVSCFGGNNGAITLTVTGGNGNYSFQWNDGVSTQNRTGLTAGNYSVTVTDQTTKCTASRSFTLYEPSSAITINGVTVNASGGLSSGSIDITVTGGTPPYTYAWNDGATTEDRSNLAPASYTVTVTDANGCKAMKSFTITGIACNLAISGYTQDVNCNGGTNGSIVITSVSGAAGTLGYAWNDGATNASRTGLAAGTYTLTVTDLATQCQASRSFVINQPSFLNTSGLVVDASQGLNNGSIDITVTGGTPPYTYRWNDGTVTEDRTNLAPGSYTVTVTDARSCTASKTFTVGGSTCTLAVSGVISNTSCSGGGDGKITLTVSGNTGPVTFLWNDGATTQNRTNLVVGWYQVTAIDQTTKCKVVQSFNIGQPTPLAYKATVTDVSVAGASDGSIVSYISGGTPPYSIQWNDGTTATNRYNLPVGAYTITIVDARGCSIAYCVYVRVKGQCNLLTVTGTVTSTCGCGTNDGTISLAVSGGTAPYTYKWSDGPATQNRTALAAGTYTVTVTDAVGCTKTVSYTVTTAIIYNLTTVNLSDRLATAEAVRNLTATVSPNPATTGLVKLVVHSPVNTTALVTVLDINGRKMLASSFSLTKGVNYKELNLAGTAGGIYNIELLTTGERKVLKLVVYK